MLSLVDVLPIDWLDFCNISVRISSNLLGKLWMFALLLKMVSLGALAMLSLLLRKQHRRYYSFLNFMHHMYSYQMIDNDLFVMYNIVFLSFF